MCDLSKNYKECDSKKSKKFKSLKKNIFENKYHLRSSKERTRMSIYEKENVFHSYREFESQSLHVSVLRIKEITTTKRYRLNKS